MSFFVLGLSGCLVAAESDVGEAASPMSAGGSGGGGSGGGGESIGVAQQAATGCCCTVPVGEGKPGKCRKAADASECKYEEYREDAACNSGKPPEGVCSVSGAVGGGEHGGNAGVEGFAVLLALGTVVRRRRRLLVPSGAGSRTGSTEAAPMADARG